MNENMLLNNATENRQAEVTLSLTMQELEHLVSSLVETRLSTLHPFKVLTTEDSIVSILKELGISPHLSGYRYLLQAIDICMKNSCESMRTIKDIYEPVAHMYKTTTNKVERVMRHAIAYAWDLGNTDAYEKYFGNTIPANKGAPVNSLFIFTVADYIMRA